MNQEKIGKFIQELRKEKNLTQSDIAEKLGVTNRSISNWENGKCMPDLSLFKPLCEIFDISINELMSGEKISNDNYQSKLEENIINTIDEKTKYFDRTGYLIFNTLGIVIFLVSCLSWSIPGNFQIFSALFGSLFIVISLNKIIKKKINKIITSILISIILVTSIIFTDYIFSHSLDYYPKIYLKKYGVDNIIVYNGFTESTIYCNHNKEMSRNNNIAGIGYTNHIFTDDELRKICNNWNNAINEKNSTN